MHMKKDAAAFLRRLSSCTLSGRIDRFDIPNCKDSVPREIMADPIGCVSLAIQLTSRIIDYAGKVKDSFEERTRLITEISAATGILAILKELSTANNGSKSTRLDALYTLANPNGPLARYFDVLKFIEEQLETRTGFQKTRATLTWPLRREKVLESLREVERYKGYFMIALQVDNM